MVHIFFKQLANGTNQKYKQISCYHNKIQHGISYSTISRKYNEYTFKETFLATDKYPCSLSISPKHHPPAVAYGKKSWNNEDPRKRMYTYCHCQVKENSPHNILNTNPFDQYTSTT